MANLFSDLIAFFEGSVAASPAAQQAITDVKTAETSVAAAIEPVANDILNAVLERIPLVGGLLTGPADAVLDSFLAKLLTRFPGAPSLAPVAAAKAAAQATMAPIPN